MYVNQNNYEEIIFKKNPKYIYIWLSVIVLLLSTIITVGCFYKFNRFYKINGLVIQEGNDNYVQILLENDKLDIIKDDDLVIDKKVVEFNPEISSYIYSDTGRAYREVKLFFQNNFDNGEIVNLTFKSPQTTLIKELKIKIMKGMM